MPPLPSNRAQGVRLQYSRATRNLIASPRRRRLCPHPAARPAAFIPPLPASAERLSYVRGATEVPLLEETIGRALERAAATWGGGDAVISVAQGARLSYLQLLEQASEVARGLLALGVGRGDRVAIWGPNCTEWTLLSYAAFQARAGPPRPACCAAAAGVAALDQLSRARCSTRARRRWVLCWST